MVFGHNLHHVAPFEIPRAGFCMVFQRASFVFSCPGADFGSQVNILGWGAFWAEKMVPKKIVLWRNDFVVGVLGESILPK